MSQQPTATASSAAAERPTRPLVKPALRRVWRDPGTLQLGLAPRHAVVLAGLTDADRHLLDLLDGTRDTGEVLDAAATIGLDSGRAAELLEALHAAGVLDDAAMPQQRLAEDTRQRLEPDALSLSLRHREPGGSARAMQRRLRARVAVHGTGRVGASVAGLLAAAGVGHVACVDDQPVRAADLAPGGIATLTAGSRGDAAAAQAGRVTGRALATSAPATATLALITPTASLPAPEVLARVRHQPHLLAAVRETSTMVGPLVLPGQTPCLRCLSLARGDRDPHWPLMAAQLVGSRRPVEPCDITLATLTAALTAMHALAFIDGDATPSTVGGVLEFDLGDGLLRRRRVAAHPGCGCGAHSG